MSCPSAANGIEGPVCLQPPQVNGRGCVGEGVHGKKAKKKKRKLENDGGQGGGTTADSAAVGTPPPKKKTKRKEKPEVRLGDGMVGWMRW